MPDTITPQLKGSNGVVLASFSPAIVESLAEQAPICRLSYVGVVEASHNVLMASEDTGAIRRYNEWRPSVAANPCTLYGPKASTRSIGTYQGYSPLGHEGLLFVTLRRTTTVVESSEPCRRYEWFGGIGIEYDAICRVIVESLVSAGTTIYRLDMRNMTVALMPWSEPRAELLDPGVGESGREFTTFRRVTDSTKRYHFNSARQPVTTTTQGEQTCRTQFRNFKTGALRLNPTGCWSAGGDGGFSPSTAPLQ